MPDISCSQYKRVFMHENISCFCLAVKVSCFWLEGAAQLTGPCWTLTQAQTSSYMKAWQWRSEILDWPLWRPGGAVLDRWSKPQDLFYGWSVHCSKPCFILNKHLSLSFTHIYTLRPSGSRGDPDAGQQPVQFPIRRVFLWHCAVWINDRGAALLTDSEPRSGNIKPEGLQNKLLLVKAHGLPKLLMLY